MGETYGAMHWEMACREFEVLSALWDEKVGFSLPGAIARTASNHNQTAVKDRRSAPRVWNRRELVQRPGIENARHSRVQTENSAQILRFRTRVAHDVHEAAVKHNFGEHTVVYGEVAKKMLAYQSQYHKICGLEFCWRDQVR